MKKILFLLPFTALVMASCSNEDMIQESASVAQNSDQLTIRPIVSNASRGTVANSLDLTEFMVKIYGSFNTTNDRNDPTAWVLPSTQKMTGSGSSWSFPDGVQFWWADQTTTAEFKAWAPVHLTETNNIIADYEVAADIADQEDIIVAYNSGKRNSLKAGVPLNFQHVLSQIVLRAVNKDLAYARVEIAGARIVNVANRNSLTLPATPTTSGVFSWEDYTPWPAAATGSATYGDGVTYSNAQGVVLTDLPESIISPEKGAMLLMPQDLPDVTDLSQAYIAVLARITEMGPDVALKNYEGKYIKADGSGTVPFDTKYPDGAAENNTYEAAKLDLAAGTYDGIAIRIGKKVIYPREGRGNNSQLYAYIAVPITTEWLPGYKYTYTLNFDRNAYGLAAGDQNTDLAYEGGEYPTNDPDIINYPYGIQDTGNIDEHGIEDVQDEPVQPNEPIVDAPVQLIFTTVTVSDWSNAAEETPEMH